MISYTQHRFSYLLGVLFLAILIQPLLGEYTFLSILNALFLSLIFIFGCFTTSKYSYTPWIATFLAIPMLLSIWIIPLGLNLPTLHIIGKFSGVSFIALISGSILLFIFTARRVNWEVISAALVVYLLLGLMWAECYEIVVLLQPDSFKTGLEHTHEESLYFSFITLTTLGYGDITPISGIARSLAMLEGIIGQSYMAVLVARLVGMHVAYSMNEK